MTCSEEKSSEYKTGTALVNGRSRFCGHPAASSPRLIYSLIWLINKQCELGWCGDLSIGLLTHKMRRRKRLAVSVKSPQEQRRGKDKGRWARNVGETMSDETMQHPTRRC